VTTHKWYGKAFEAVFNKEVDVDTDVIKGMIVGSGYTFDQDAHKYKSSIAGEVTGTGYTAGGATIGSVSVSYTGGTNVFAFDGNDISWANSTLNSGANIPLGCVIYDSSPASDATRPVLCFIDFEGQRPTTNGTLSVSFDALGIAKVTVS
jgi:hypothetical protein